MGTRVPGYPHLKLMGTQVSLPGPGYIITKKDPKKSNLSTISKNAILWYWGVFYGKILKSAILKG